MLRSVSESNAEVASSKTSKEGFFSSVQKELNELAKNRTTLIIAHRLSTITHAHQILVMEAGSIIERGTHESLLKEGQRYAEMWRVQQSQIHSLAL